MLREKSCGVVPFREVEGEILYLVISSAVTKREHWEFPKGGVEEGEREIETALRELWEETGVKDVRLLPGFREPIRYIYRRPEGLVSKQVVYFIGKVNNPAVTLREVEAKDYRWAGYEETRKLLRHANARALLERCHAFITGRPLRPQAPRALVKPEAGDAAEAIDKPKRRRRRRRGGRPPEARAAAAAAAGTKPAAETQAQTPVPRPQPEGPRAAGAGQERDRRQRRGRRRRGGRPGQQQQAQPARPPPAADKEP